MSAAAVVAAIDHRRAEPDRAGADRRRRRDGGARRVGNLLRFAPPVVAVDDALRFAADRVEQPGPVLVEAAGAAVAAEHALAMFALARRQPRRHRLPLAEVLVDEPVDELGDPPLDLARRIADDLLLELALHPRAVEEIEDAAEPQRVVEVLVPARLHLEQHLLDRRSSAVRSRGADRRGSRASCRSMSSSALGVAGQQRQPLARRSSR